MLYTVYGCSWHSIVTARLNSEWPDGILLEVHSQFVNMNVFEMDRKWLVVNMQYFTLYYHPCLFPPLQLGGGLVTAIFPY